MNNVKQYIEANNDRFLEELFSLIRIPSISAESEHKEDMVRCANRWRELLLAAGCDKAEVMPSAGNPVVYGEKTIDPSKPTVLVYGHYDVMPVAPLELWNTKPFEPVIKDERYGLAVPMTTKVRASCRPRPSNSWSRPASSPATSSSCSKAKRRLAAAASTASARSTRRCSRPTSSSSATLA